MREAEGQNPLEELNDLERRYRESIDLRDYQLWVGDVQPADDAEEFRKKELRELCKGVVYDRNEADADEIHLANTANALTELRDEERYYRLEIPPAEDAFDNFRVTLVKNLIICN
jgi:hypothetical protein